VPANEWKSTGNEKEAEEDSLYFRKVKAKYWHQDHRKQQAIYGPNY